MVDFQIYDKVVYSYTYKNANYIKLVIIFAYQIAYSKILYIILKSHFALAFILEYFKTIYYVQKCTSTDTAFPFPEFTQTDILTQACRDGCAKTFTAALFALAKGYNHHKCLPALELLNMSLQSNIMYLLKLTRQVYGYRIRMVSKVYIFEKKSYRRVLMTQDAIYLSISIHV